MTTKELLKTCYKSFAQKQGWEAVISDDFKFVGGDMTKREPVVGKQAYIDVIKRFSQVFQNMWVKEMMTDGDSACVIGNYDYVFPNGKSINSDVAEIWKVKRRKNLYKPSELVFEMLKSREDGKAGRKRSDYSLIDSPSYRRNTSPLFSVTLPFIWID